MKGGFYSRREIAGLVQKIRSPYMGFGAGKVFFVNGSTGLDSNDGDDPENPLKTVTKALTKCVADRDDYIMIIKAGTDTHPIVVDVKRVHIIGVTGPTALVGPGYISGAAAGFRISADDVEIAGLNLFADATHPGIEIAAAEYCWRLWVHHCRFGITLPTQDGIVKAAGGVTEGPVGALIEDNIFGQEIGRDGIRVAAPTYTVFRNNLFMYHVGVGINITGGNFAEIFGNRFVGRNVEGDAITVTGEKGIVAHNWTAYQTTDGAALNTPYKDDGTNHWADNYINNTLIEPA